MGKIFLIIINIIFMLLGIGLIVTGSMATINTSVVSDEVMPLLNQVIVGGMRMGDAVKSLSVGLIVIGAVILVVAGLGAFGACCEKKVLLIVYAIIVALLWISQIVFVILWFVMGDELESGVKTQLESELNNNYQYDDLTTAAISTSWNHMCMKMECCGVSNVLSTSNDYTTSKWQTGNPTPSQKIPNACCQGVTVISYNSYVNTACTTTVTTGYHKTGCYQAIKDEITAYKWWFVGFGITLLILQIIAIVAACLICKQTRKDMVV